MKRAVARILLAPLVASGCQLLWPVNVEPDDDGGIRTDGRDVGVACGDTVCDLHSTTPLCCRTTAASGSIDARCIPPPDTDCPESVLHCDDAADCVVKPGTICCVNTTGAPRAYCAESCGAAHAVLCDPHAPSCPSGTACLASETLLPGYSVCEKLDGGL